MLVYDLSYFISQANASWDVSQWRLAARGLTTHKTGPLIQSDHSLSPNTGHFHSSHNDAAALLKYFILKSQRVNPGADKRGHEQSLYRGPSSQRGVPQGSSLGQAPAFLLIRTAWQSRAQCNNWLQWAEEGAPSCFKLYEALSLDEMGYWEGNLKHWPFTWSWWLTSRIMCNYFEELL